eukprot:g33338.t1
MRCQLCPKFCMDDKLCPNGSCKRMGKRLNSGEEVELRSVKGLQGLLLEGLGGPEAFNHFTTIAASGGRLRFAELRYPSLRQAKIRAVLLYFCTFNFKRRAFIPLLRRQQLYDVQTAYDILRLWDWGFEWFRQSYMDWIGHIETRLASSCSDSMTQKLPRWSTSMAKPHGTFAWNGNQSRRSIGQKRSKEENRKNALQRLAELKKKRRYRDLEERFVIQEILVSVSVPQLLEALETGRLPGDVDLHSVEASAPGVVSAFASAFVLQAWILGNGANFAHDRASDQKLLAKRAAADKLAMKRRKADEVLRQCSSRADPDRGRIPQSKPHVMHPDLAGGKYYRKKGKVERVRQQFAAEIRMLEGRDLIRLDQEMLEHGPQPC